MLLRVSDAQPKPRGRAAPLPQDARRKAIVTATLPLLRQFGRDVTTRQIAEAAGIAEGTIFRVFPDKEAVIDAAVDNAMDTTPFEDELRALAARDLALHARVAAAAELIMERIGNIWVLMAALRRFPVGPGAPSTDHRRALLESRERVLTAIAEVFEPDRHHLRRPPREAAKLLRALVFGGTHPVIVEGEPLRPDDIASLLLDGLLDRPSTPSATTDRQSRS
jgi:AcrR family transcriptional regulator